MHDTEEKLLEATLRLVSEKGYLGATTREIARKAGVTELTLFRHFGSKEKLFEKVLERYSFLPRLRELLPKIEKLPYDRALRIVGMRFFETLKEQKSMIVIMLSEINLYPEKIRLVFHKFVDEIRRTLADYLESLQKKGVLRPFPPKMATRAFIGMIFSYFMAEEIMGRRDIDKKEMEKVIREVVDMFVKGTLKR